MKAKMIAISLTILFALSASSISALAADPTSKASVSFKEGDIEIVVPEEGETGLSTMDLDFGERDIPDGGDEYKAVTGPYSLTVTDGRKPARAGDWSLSVRLTSFEPDTTTVNNSRSAFDATISLANPTSSCTNSAYESDRTLADDFIVQNPVTVASGAGIAPVASATEDALNGQYKTTWTNANVTLTTDDDIVNHVTDVGPYVATLTWSLTFEVV